ncbi:unnamed protein product [Didymodactylos carnosus]|uniref:NAD(P)(+)--arginine ADP-ribosyltransferase n=1 Tax=Didymodactylos carnosus TaxID=1234261 RepID=A0A815QHS2_9BILA|nr:unnamed protein product [Didymodactylos carnosus]CAF1464175.1 unnamed protein product [Didymodactylos carnosus]CAF3738680.1 unnamed protein product [Didymodactylos carnosus]CAF4333716.1 unnamed protein product [Didymodactylos carnosus]
MTSSRLNMAQDGYIPTERFHDVSCEPQQRLALIRGYELKPLISLEEAVHPLEELIGDIQDFVWTATGNCEQPRDELTPNERAAIYLYTMGYMYHQLNSALRNEQRQLLLPYFFYLKLFLTALWKLQDFTDVIWRGEGKNLTDQYPEGKKFVCCTPSLNVLQKEAFLGETGQRTLFNIQCYNGKSIQNHAQFPDEKEVLLMPCSYFQVMSSVEQDSDLRIIHIKQIEPPVTLIRPPSSSFSAAAAAHSHSSTTAEILKKKPKLSISISTFNNAMGANDKYLVCKLNTKLSFLDEQGNNKLNINWNLHVNDICWSSYLN